MGITSNIRRGLDAIVQSTVASPLSPRSEHLLPVIASDLGLENIPLTRKEALKNPTLSRARGMIVPTIARLPLVAVQDGKAIKNQPIWINRSDHNQSPFVRMLNTADDLFFYGFSLWRIERDFDRYVIHAEHVPYDLWGVNILNEITINDQVMMNSDVALFIGVNDGVLSFGDEAIRFSRTLATAAAKAAKTPSANIVLKQTNEAVLNDDDIDSIIARWVRARRGENQGVGFLTTGLDAETMDAPVEQLLIEGRRDAAIDIARVCGIPAAMVDAVQSGSSLSYSNVESRLHELITFGISPMMDAIAARLSMDDIVPRGTSVNFDTSAIMTALPNDDGRLSLANETKD